MTEGITPIAADDLGAAWTTLTTLLENYATGGLGWATLCEARRLIEVEIRSQHGDDVWAVLIGGDDD